MAVIAPTGTAPCLIKISLYITKRLHRPFGLCNLFVIFGASGDTELFEKASNINGFQGGRVANNLYISPFRTTVFKTAALFLYLNSSVVIRVRKPLFFPL